MKRPFLIAAAIAALGFTGWAALTYPAVGKLALDADTRIEIAIAGLKRATVNVGDSRMMTWQGGPDDAAETVVMIHGYSADKTVWMRFAPHFTDRYRVLVLDLPGHGETPFDAALRYDTLSQAQRVLKAMDVLGIQKAHLVGNSMGGFIAAQLALHHPERVQSATLMDAAGVIAPQPSDMEQMLSRGEGNPFELTSRAAFDRFYAMTMAQPPWVPGMTLDWIAADYAARRASLARIFQDFHHVDLLDARLAEITVPVLVMWGDQDRLVHRSAAEVWARGIPGAQRVSYPDLGHMPMVEDPARSAADVRTFIGHHG
ncbi:MAG: alpha/beta fold hydrolase [Nevskia sp.]|uniref:alpha/beta fold hydrolase n=1 Tax=Nevskia sp. TaxID=1929292 RepID=UPI0040355763